MLRIKEFLKINREILSINRRNQEYIRPLNSLSARRLADNKLKTKRLLAKHDILTPEVYKVIRTKKQLEFVDWHSLPNSFVIKPNRGSIGSGILVFVGKHKNKLEWIRPNGKVMNVSELRTHIEKILEGRFSMGNRKDIVIIEERIQTHKDLKKYSYKGVPDIRVIIYNNIPVMAQVRLPTKRSDGKANLHTGGICAGIDIASGVTTHAMHLKKRSLIEDTYDTVEYTFDFINNLPLQGLKVPYWDEILETAIKCQRVSGLGYLGVDIVIDRDKGPMILELNARPGLGIQSANAAGLRIRLERVKGLKVKSIKHGIRLAKNLFGGEVEEGIESMSGKKVVNLVEKIQVYHAYLRKNRVKYETVSALLDTGIITSRIDRGLAARLGYSKSLKDYFSREIPDIFDDLKQAQEFIDEYELELIDGDVLKRLAKIVENGRIKVRPVIDIEVKIAGNKKKIEAIISNQSDMVYPILIGRTELQDFLIDASKTFTK